MATWTTQPGIGDGDDLKLRLVTGINANTGQTGYAPQVHAGAYFLPPANAASADEFFLYSDPSALYGPYTLTANTVSTRSITAVTPDFSYPVFVYARRTAGGPLERFTQVATLQQTETPIVQRYPIARTVESITGATLTMAANQFPPQLPVGARCWRESAPAERYTIVTRAAVARTIVLDRAPAPDAVGSWRFEVAAVRLLYPQGAPKLLEVTLFPRTGTPAILTTADYSYDPERWLVVTDAAQDGAVCQVQYYADDTYAAIVTPGRTETAAVGLYALARTAASTTDAQLNFSSSQFPKNLPVGARGWKSASPETTYTVVSSDPDAYTVTLDRAAGTTGSSTPWVFEVHAVQMRYSDDSPILDAVTMPGDEGPVTIPTADCYVVSGRWVIVPAEVALETLVTVRYKDDYEFKVFSSRSAPYSVANGTGYFFCCQKVSDATPWRAIDVNLNPLASELDASFLYLSDSLPVPARVDFGFGPFPGVIVREYLRDEDNALTPRFHPLTARARVLGADGVYIARQTVAWYYQLEDGQPIAVSTQASSRFKRDTVTTPNGTVGGIFLHEFLDGIGLEPDQRVRFILYLGAAPITGDVETSASPWLSVVTRGSDEALVADGRAYLHCIATPTAPERFTLCAWEELILDGVCRRVALSDDTVTFYRVTADAVVVLSGANNVATVPLSETFPHTAVLPAIALVPGDRVYAVRTRTAEQAGYPRTPLTSNYVTIG